MADSQAGDGASGGSRSGAVRHAEWGRGVTFREQVTDWSPYRRLALTFDIPEETRTALLDDHLRVQSDYLGLVGGGYTLKPLPGGRTGVTLHTRYRIRTPFNGYAALWGELFLGDFHRNVLRVVENRSESRRSTDHAVL